MGLAMDATGIVLRDYRKTDLEAMYQLDAACFAAEFRFDRESMRAFAGAPNAMSVVAEKSGYAVAGFVIAHLERKLVGLRGYVVTLDVSAGCRRIGLASRLMREVESRAVAAEARRMDLHVFTGNLEAIRFYERLGYMRIGMRSWFYGATASGVGLDAFAYRKELVGL